ncbi:hypothetical protein D3C86_2044680 [compost metagenome]
MVLRSEDIFSRRDARAPAGDAAAGADAAGLAGAAVAGAGAAFSAFNASSFMILPPEPEPFTSFGSIPFSARIFAATGDACFSL